MVPAQEPPVQAYNVAAGLQFDTSVEGPPDVTEAGDAERVQVGEDTGDEMSTTVAE